jgi:hypothetical protein
LAAKPVDHGRLIKLDSVDELQDVMREYHVSVDATVKPIPHYMCDNHGAMTGSL